MQRQKASLEQQILAMDSKFRQPNSVSAEMQRSHLQSIFDLMQRAVQFGVHPDHPFMFELEQLGAGITVHGNTHAAKGPVGTLEGAVTAVSGGAGVENATVEVIDYRGYGLLYSSNTTTDALGNWSLVVPQGSYFIKVAAPSGYVNAIYDETGSRTCFNTTYCTRWSGTLVTAGSSTVSGLDVELESSGSMSGSADVAGARVVVYDQGGLAVGMPQLVMARSSPGVWRDFRPGSITPSWTNSEQQRRNSFQAWHVSVLAQRVWVTLLP